MTIDELALTWGPAIPGEIWIAEDRRTLALLLTVDGEQAPVTRVKSTRKQIEVLGAIPELVTRARITYLEHVEVRTLRDAERRAEAPVVGKRYVFAITGAGVTVTCDDGTAPPPDEAAALEGDRQRFGPADRFGSILAARRYRLGESVELPADQVADVLGGDLEVTRLVVTFVERAGNDPVFLLAIDVRSRGGSAAVTEMSLTGTVRIDAIRARVLDLAVAGAMRTTGAATGDGTVEIISRRTAPPP